MAKNNLTTVLPTLDDEEVFVANATKKATTFLQDLVETSNKAQLFEKAGDNVPKPLKLIVEPVEDTVADLPKLENAVAATTSVDGLTARELSTEQLKQGVANDPGNTFFSDEINIRDKINNGTFLEKIQNPEIYGEQVNRLGRQAARSLVDAFDPGFLFNGVGGLLGKAGEAITGKDFGADAMLVEAGRQSEENRRSVGISEAINLSETGASLLGAFIPLPGGGKIAAANKLLSVVAPTTSKVLSAAANGVEYITPFVIGSGKFKRAAIGGGLGFTVDQVIREQTDDAGTAYQTVFDNIAAATNVVIDPAEGTSKPLSNGVLTTMGLVLGGSAVLPVAIAGFRKAIKPRPMTARLLTELDASNPKNLSSVETLGNLLKTQLLDDKTPITDILRQAHVAVKELDVINQAIDVNTGSAAATVASNALETGVLHSQGGSFVSKVIPVVLRDVYKRFNPELRTDVNSYLLLGDFTDDLKLQIKQKPAELTKGFSKKKLLNISNANKRLSKRINKATVLLKNTKAERALLREKYPNGELTKFSKDYQTVTEASLEFLSTGNNPLFTKQAVKALKRNRPHYVQNVTDVEKNKSADLLTRVGQAFEKPKRKNTQIVDTFLQQRDFNQVTGIKGRADSVETLLRFVETAIQTKLKMDTQIQIIDAVTNTKVGRSTFRLATKKEIKTDRFAQNLITVIRGGKKETYIGTKLFTTLLRFDPFVLTSDFGILAHGIKRIFEKGTTGKLGITYAPILMFRDIFVGALNTTQKGMVGPTVLTTFSAVGSSVIARTQKALFQSIDARLRTGEAFPFLSKPALRKISAKMSQEFHRSNFYLAQVDGGVHASINTTAVKNGKGVFTEIGKSIEPLTTVAPVKLIRAVARGFGAVFDSIAESPRQAAFNNTIAKGVDPVSAANFARNLTGNPRRGGRVFNPDGSAIGNDVINPRFLIAAHMLGYTTNGLRVTAPFIEPTIQGIRRVFQAIEDNPLRFTRNAWLRIGLPSLAFYGWNELLGPEYNIYAQEQRTEQNKAMTMYVGVPGKEPRFGLEIPVGHEGILFLQPWVSLVHNLRKTDEEVDKAVMNATMVALGTMTGVPMPTFIGLAFNAAGIQPPQDVNRLFNGAYKIRPKDDFMNANLEAGLKTAFGSITGVVADFGRAFVEEGEIGAGFEQLGNSLIKKTALLKNIAGTQTPVTNFTTIKRSELAKVEAFDMFNVAYDEHFNPKTRGVVRGNRLPRGDIGATGQGAFSPPVTTRPTNPLFELYGAQIREIMKTNSFGMSNLVVRGKNLSKQLKGLRAYNAGSKKAFNKFQTELEKSPQQFIKGMKLLKLINKKDPAFKLIKKRTQNLLEMVRTAKIMQENGIKLGTRKGVTELVTLLENENMTVLKQRLGIIKTTEDELTRALQRDGRLPPGEKFKFEKHMGLMDQGLSLPPQNK